MFVAIRVEYQRWKKWAFPGLLLTILLLVAVFIPGIGYGFGGARRWISLGSTTFQPTELLKLTFVMYLATWVEKRGSAIKDAAYGFAPFVASLGIVAVLV